MAQIFNIQDDKVVINKLALRYLEGAVIHAGSFDIIGNASIQSNLQVMGTITADTINVKNLISENGSTTDSGRWIVEKESDLNGKGLLWAWGDGGTQLSYRTGGRLWVSSDFDLDTGKSYKIDDVIVLSLNELGSQVTKSRLKEVGTLKSLEVLGNTTLSEFAFFNAATGRMGINTDQPTAAITIVENDVEIIAGSPNFGTAIIGTHSNHNLSIVTDNTPRVLFKNTGEVVFGSERTKTASVTIHGQLNVNTVIADTRIERYYPLEFKTTKSTPGYGQGLIWSGTGDDKQFILRPEPDRFWSSESIDLSVDHSYFINGAPVLTQTSLGASVLDSNLASVGLLRTLNVQGDVNLQSSVEVGNTLKSPCVIIDGGEKFISIKESKINASPTISINVFEDEVYYADNNEITIGNKLNTRRPVKIYGPMSVGITNPDPSVSLSVKGNISFNNKKFVTGEAAPSDGSFVAGDICWNETPTEGNYIGWVCVVEGTPGTWAPFGLIDRV